jgi:ADP-dependent NAD(P)H-hydrate dehydratase / NAD(P)H-hydrate epimerase
MSGPRPLRPFSRGPVPAPTAEEAARADREAIEGVGVPGPVLMEGAGRGAALLIQHLFPSGPVLVVAGSGNNGGDGAVVARTLRAWGRPVTLVHVGSPAGWMERLHGWELPLVDGTDSAGGDEGLPGAPAVVVDALLGTGSRGVPRASHAAWIGRIERSGVPVVALDLPSGVDPTTGAVPGEAITARLTVAFGGPKLGTLLHPARARTGRLVAIEIGLPPAPEEGCGALLTTPAWAAHHVPRRTPDTHKYEVGSLLLLAGSPGMGGAALLAARAALRSGTGLLRIASHPDNRELLQSSVPEAVWVDATDEAALLRALSGVRALAAGPGLGRDGWAHRALGRLLEAAPIPTVLDADALPRGGSGSPVPGSRPLLLTPHAGEMGRLLDRARDRVQADRPASAREAACLTGAAVLLKGTPSLVALPDGRLFVDSGGSSDLAQAGMGDVLTGVAGALLAGGVRPAEAGALALHFTGRAAGVADRGAGLSPEDVIAHLPDALREEGGGWTDLPFPFVTLDMDPAR